jgi:hypothetical protein
MAIEHRKDMDRQIAEQRKLFEVKSFLDTKTVQMYIGRLILLGLVGGIIY